MRPARRTWPALVAVAGLLLPLSACGDPVQAYCGSLRDHREKLSEIVNSGSPTALIDNLPLLKKIAGRAPSDLTDEWQTFLNAIEGLDQALHDANVDPGAFHGGHPPAGLTAAQRKDIADAASQLASPQVVGAADGIVQQARDVCHLDLEL
ncbi:MAG TPA: hypothetical protein VFR99_06415 [Marmoricola sp.]|nr:hypothetical protein [Marmoricola sp.]